MAKRMTPAQRCQHCDARAPTPADNRPAVILPVTLSGSDTATLKLRRAGVTLSPAGIAAIIRMLTLY